MKYHGHIRRLRRSPLRRVRAAFEHLLPRFDEPISHDFYRATGRLRVWVVLAIAIASFSSILALDPGSGDVGVFWRLQALVAGLSAVDLALGAWIWRGRLDVPGMRRLTYAAVAVETALVLSAVHAFGSVNSHMVVGAILIVIVYRLGLDLRIGVTALVMMLGGHWAIALVEALGLRAAQPVLLQRDFVYTVPSNQLAAMLVVSSYYLVAFLTAHWAVARARYREAAVRILRESLQHAGADGIGRFTGAVLRGRYDVECLVGSGGMGEVYTGRHRRTRRAVAIKVLHAHLREDPDLPARFRREARITGQLDSEHIVQILDVDEHEGHPFLVFELLEGEDLRALLRREGPLPVELLVDVITNVAAGLDVAHAAGVVHRDIKPANIFLVAGQQGLLMAKILDFGVSTSISAGATQTAITRETSLVGTPAFMAPEQIDRRFGDIGPRTDVFALAASAYLALTGTAPFAAELVPEALFAVCHTDPAPPSSLRPGLGPDMDDVFELALAKQTIERLGHAGELAVALRAAAAGALDARTRARAAAVRAARMARPAGPALTPSDPGDVGTETASIAPRRHGPG